jgi:hypothetical protein
MSCHPGDVVPVGTHLAGHALDEGRTRDVQLSEAR